MNNGCFIEYENETEIRFDICTAVDINFATKAGVDFYMNNWRQGKWHNADLYALLENHEYVQDVSRVNHIELLNMAICLNSSTSTVGTCFLHTKLVLQYSIRQIESHISHFCPLQS